MSRPTQWLNRWLHKDRADLVEYVLLLSVLLLSAVATGSALTHKIGNEINMITNRI
jgi:hypothetical protein